MTRIFTLAFVLSLSALACSSEAPGSNGDEADVTRAKKTVVGYDFTGLKIAKPLPTNHACAEGSGANIALVDACIAAKARTIFTSTCDELCSVPVAPKGKVVGFDFGGFKVADELGPNHACAESGGATLAVVDACLAAKGRTVFTKTCDELCSIPIAPKGKVVGFDFSGLQTSDALPPNHACP